ncbi:MAG: RNA polymerase Rpb4 family protein [Candidatus Hadarchaeales archaeon]
MIGSGIVSERPVTLAEVLQLLEEIKKERELRYEQRLDYDYAQKFVRVKPDGAAKLVEELMKNFELRETVAVQLVDLMPETPEEVEMLLSKERKRLSPEETKKLLELLDQYRK